MRTITCETFSFLLKTRLNNGNFLNMKFQKGLCFFSNRDYFSHIFKLVSTLQRNDKFTYFQFMLENKKQPTHQGARSIDLKCFLLEKKRTVTSAIAKGNHENKATDIY